MEEASPVEGPDPACGSETSVPCAESRGRILPRLETAEVPPVPVSGGTLTTGATWTVAADSDRGQVSVVRTADGALVATIEMGGEPGRVLIDTDEAFAYVTDRVGAEVVEIDLPAGKIARRLPVCQSPRGLDIGPEGSLLVACRTGTFQRIERATGEVLASTWLGDDLRDVVVNQGRVFVTRFRAAELLEVDASGAVISRRSPPTLANGTEFKPTASNTAWRTIALPDGRMVMLHQRAQLSAVGIASEGGYG